MIEDTTFDSLDIASVWLQIIFMTCQKLQMRQVSSCTPLSNFLSSDRNESKIIRTLSQT